MDKKTVKKRGGKAFPSCNTHKDCFAHKDGRCVCLNDNDFGGRDCPFYKSGSRTSMDEIRAACRLYAEAHGGSREGGVNG